MADEARVAAEKAEVRLTVEERRALGCDCWHIDGDWHHIQGCPVETVEQIVAGREARARYFAFWHYFLRLPSPSPYSDMVQREALRLRALCPTPTDVSTPPGSQRSGVVSTTFEARFHSDCDECGWRIKPGDLVKPGHRDNVVHVVCPEDVGLRPAGEVCSMCFIEKATNGECGCES